MQQIKKKKIPSLARPASAGKSSREYSRTFFTSAAGLLLATGIAMLFPLVPSPGANAEAAPLTQSARMKTETYVYSSLALALSDNVALNITPTSGGAFTTGEATLSITTNNTTGYSVYMSTGDNTSSLLPANGLVDASVNPVEGSMNASDYKTHLNEWGYALGDATADTSYTAVPKANSAPIITSEEMAADEQYKLNFGVAVGPTLPSGTYYNSVLVSAVANPIAVHTLSGITYMQEMSPYVCDYSDVGETKQLVDMRDQKSYWVAKLADNKCWMTQNLDLHLDETTLPLVKESTNLALGQESWSPASETVIGGTPTVGDKTQHNGTNSWYPGLWVDNVISNSHKCTNTVLTSGFSDCPEFFEEVSSSMSPTFSATDDKAINEDRTAYDPHYLIGTFYQSNTAMAGNAYTSDGQIKINAHISGDICPRGWRLPSGVWSSDTATIPAEGQKDTDYAKLFSSYGYKFTNVTDDNRVFGSYNSDELISPQNPPLYFVRAGYISGVTIQSPHFGGYYWQSDSGNSTDFFGMQFYNYVLFPGYDTSRALGFNVRCVAK